MIQDCEVPTADPEQLIEEYTPLIRKMTNRYKFALDRTGAVDMEDLMQAGRIAITEAHRHYDPAAGASFMTYSVFWIKRAIRRTLGINAAGEMPPEPVSLDTPASADQPDGDRLVDLIADPTTTDPGVLIVEEEERTKIRQEVREAVARMRSQKQREVITRCWIDEQDAQTAADEMGIEKRNLYALDKDGRQALARDVCLREIVAQNAPTFKVGKARFNTTWTSATERAVLWLEREYDKVFGAGAFLASGKPQDALNGLLDDSPV